ncbi:hypothetical protein [Rubritalea profundi]|uniref:Uncharacterized protein n=1 Tax=Rubritalea profundi TaxID=1658618 RepID=A0A2S7U3G6_9BACT|nr:hypothetical protein [Rubritalea profundi]PQJ29566.1 hypothetical protein BSZ32_14410 [Rubritalea profundi]
MIWLHAPHLPVVAGKAHNIQLPMDGTTTTMTVFREKGIGQKLTTGEALMQTKASLAGKAKKSANFHMCLAEINQLVDSKPGGASREVG